MAIESWGYFNEITPGVQWARTAAYATGSRFWVYNEDAANVTPLIGGTRQVQISAGQFGTFGIYNINDATVTVQLSVPASGTQWWLIVARHTWADAASATTFEAMHCGSVAQIPGDFTVNPGTRVDQPLAYVPITVGESDPGTPIDMRAMGTGKDDVLINSPLALTYLAYAGMRCRLGKTEYSNTLNAAGDAHEWLINPGPWGRVTLPSYTGGSYFAAQEGWAVGSPRVNKIVPDGNTLSASFQAGKVGGGLTFTGGGQIIDVPVLRVMDPSLRPSENKIVPIILNSPGAGNTGGWAFLGTNGVLTLYAATPSYNLASTTVASGYVSLEGSVTYTKGS